MLHLNGKRLLFGFSIFFCFSLLSCERSLMISRASTACQHEKEVLLAVHQKAWKNFLVEAGATALVTLLAGYNCLKGDYVNTAASCLCAGYAVSHACGECDAVFSTKLLLETKYKAE